MSFRDVSRGSDDREGDVDCFDISCERNVKASCDDRIR